MAKATVREKKIAANEINAKRLELEGSQITASADELNKMDGQTSSPAELSAFDGSPLSATITVGAETGGNTINVAIQLKDADGVDLSIHGRVMAYLSNDANGNSIATTAPSGHVAIGTDGLLIPQVTDKAFDLVSEADGDIDLNVVEAGAATWYLILVLPNGKLVSSAAITFAE